MAHSESSRQPSAPGPNPNGWYAAGMEELAAKAADGRADQPDPPAAEPRTRPAWGAPGAADPAARRRPVSPPPKYGRHYRPEPGSEDGAAAAAAAAAQGRDDSRGDESEPGGFAGHLANVAEPVVSAVEPIVDNLVMPVAGAIGNAIEAAATTAFDAISEHILRRPPEALANLYEAHPEAKLAAPRELGFRFVPIEDIKGTAVAGIAQRGKDFLPLPAFRGSNWEGRWKRIKDARDGLRPLPPVDLIKYQGDYWVVDGHNRVAATIDARGVGVDAMVVELVPLDARVSEQPSSVLPFFGEAGALRMAATGRAPAVGTRVSAHETPQSEIEVIDEGQSDEARAEGRSSPGRRSGARIGGQSPGDDPE
jgi:hypothetical protein